MKVFFDTNILVYAIDATEPDKQKIAAGLLKRHTSDGSLVLSTQVLSEFYVTVTRKLERLMSENEAELAVRELASFPLVQTDGTSITAAIQRSRLHKLPFWDALIIQSACEAGAQVLYSEDMQHDRVFDGVKITNPFRLAA